MVCPGREGGEHLLSTKGREGTRRTATATHLSTEDAEGRGNCNGDCNFLLSTKGHEGTRRNTKNCNGNTFVHGGHGGPRRTATATATSFCPRRAAEGHEENHCKVIIWFIHEGPRRTPYVVDADHGRRTRESGEKRSDCARRRSVLSLCEQSSPHVNGTWSVVRTFGPGVDQEIDFGNIDVILPRNWDWPVERRRI